ncbi:hypothetical protein [Nannocystis pusilla]|uniref:hypothetical protein n=1 Tax=Nannocystis pusilla TaxID=889268 RepID=UPI003DA58219
MTLSQVMKQLEERAHRAVLERRDWRRNDRASESRGRLSSPAGRRAAELLAEQVHRHGRELGGAAQVAVDLDAWVFCGAEDRRGLARAPIAIGDFFSAGPQLIFVVLGPFW